MVFSSLLFLFYFFPITLGLYFLSPKKYRNLILFISSLFFYAWGEPVYVVLMLFSTVVDYTNGMLVEKYLKKDQRNKAKFFLILAMVINLSLLCFFKYSDFLIENINMLFNTNIGLLNLPLPIGISFYTFQTMSYTIDVYRGDAKAQKNIISFGAYVALFPQLIAGPIVRYNTVAEELNHRTENYDLFAEGINRFILGLGKKVLIANNVGWLFSEITKTPLSEISIMTAWIGAIAFSLQIYFDFSGYSDMAIGLGKMLGFNFDENFNYPFISKSATEFWRRWHISLGTWFREYLYIPLGGNRRKPLRNYINIFAVWMATGIWHGASWNFVLWGLFYGVIIIIEKLFLLKHLKKAPNILQHIYLLLLTIVGFTIFTFDNMSVLTEYLRIMFGLNGNVLIDTHFMYYFTTHLILFTIAIVCSTPLLKSFYDKGIENNNKVIEYGYYVFLFVIFFVCVAYLVDASFNPFLYFRF